MLIKESLKLAVLFLTALLLGWYQVSRQIMYYPILQNRYRYIFYHLFCGVSANLFYCGCFISIRVALQLQALQVRATPILGA